MRDHAQDDLDSDYTHDDHDDHSHSHDHHNASQRALLVALAVNTAFFVVELAGAYLADSLTLFADAAHMLTDSGSLLLALLAAWITTLPPDEKRTYGYHRAEVLGGFLNALFLLAVVGYILFDAFQRFQNPKPVDAPVVVVVGVVGLAANLLGAWVLSGHRGSLNVEGAFLHLLADAAGSVAAIVLGVALLFTDFYLLDPIFALLVAVLVLGSVVSLLRDSLNILLQGTPRDIDLGEVARVLCDAEGVVGVHDLHVWALDSRRTAMSGHVVAGPDADRDAVLRRVQAVLGDRFGVDHATVQVESNGHVETCELDCYPTDVGPESPETT